MKLISLAVPFLLLPNYQIDESDDRVIYGEDHRQEVYQFSNDRYRGYARSVAAMVSKNRLVYLPLERSYRLLTRSLGNLGYCSEERFYEQPVLSLCSGFLVASDLLVTAGHCVKDKLDCRKYYWIFDFQMSADGEIPEKIPATEVYRCAEVVEGEYDYFSLEDHGLIRLSRVPQGRSPLNFRREGKPALGTPLVVIGHPLGLPKKISDGGVVRTNNSPYHFKANLDTYDGSSGSPVFNAELGIVEGVLTGGEYDYIEQKKNECYLSQVCEDEGCRGEDVHWITNIDYLANFSSKGLGW